MEKFPVKFPLRRLFATSFLIAIILFNSYSAVFTVQAAATISVSAITWNVVGLDSNNVNVGPNIFPVGARVCNTGDAVAYNVKSTFNWTSAATYIGLRSGSTTSFTANGINLSPGSCFDFYYELEITRNSAAYDTTRHYTISATANTASDNSGTILNGVTPTNREIYVEHLISQNRNSTTDVKLDGVSIPVGGTMTLVVGNTYNITLVGATATQGYNQIEDYISIPNTIFRVNSVATYYSADNSAYVPNYNNKLYGDACYWDNDYTSTTYRSCIGSDGKAGGSVTTTYNVTIISGAGSQSMNSMIYDFSGSSYHYNSDFATSARNINLVSPTDLQFSKSFSPSTTTAGGTSTLSFTITNPDAVSISDVNFADTLPGTLVVASTPAVSTTNCGTPVITATAGSGTISASNITLAPTGTCVISVTISAPSNTGSPFTNTSGHLFVGTLDTTKTATANLTVNAYTAPTGVCSTFQAAKWSFATGSSATAPAADATPAVTATAKNGAGLTPVVIDTSSSVSDGTGSWNTTAPIATSATLSPSLDQYYQFAINTAGMTSLQLSFSYMKSNTGPKALAVYYGSTEKPTGAAETGTLKSYTFTAPSTSWTGSGNITFSSSEIVNGTTYFRIYPYNSQVTSSSVFNIDAVLFTGTGCFPPQPAKLSKSFTTDPIAVTGTSVLTFTLNNPNSTLAFTNLSFTDTLPTGLTFNGFTPSSQCGGTLTRSSASTISFAGGTLAAGASCNVTATVTGGSAGAYNNTSSFITATYDTGSGSANITNSSAEGFGSDTLSVLQAPSITKLFGTNPILEGGISTLSFIITNPNQSDSLPSVSFSDTLPTSPAQMLVAATPNITYSDCGSGVLTPAGDRRSFTFSGATIAAGGTCTVTVDITAPTAGTYTNSTSNVKATISSVDATGNSDSDTLLVNAAHPGISIIKQISATASGPWSNNLVTALPSTVYYRITIENTGDVPLSPVTVTDPSFTAALAGCTWPATLPVASATQDPTASCTFSISAGASPSTLTNTASVSGTYASTPYTATDSATYANADLVLVKTVTETSYSSSGTTLHYNYLVTNNGASILSGPVTITDSNTTVTCPAGNLAAAPGPGNTMTCTATYITTAADVSLGSITNLATATAGGVTSNRAVTTITMSRADLSVTKTDDTGGAKILGTPFNWTITVTNIGDLAAPFTAGQYMLRDPLPAGPTYGSPSIGSITNITNSGNISCSVDGSNVLTCRANGGTVTLGSATGSFAVTISVTPAGTGTLTNTATADPNVVLVESTKSNNSATDSVVVSNYTKPTIVKGFSPAAIASGGTSTITFTLTNPNPANLTSATFTDTLSNMSISGAQSAGGTCVGAGTNSFANGATSLTFSGLTIPASSNCTVTVLVSSSTVGTHPNTASGITTAQTTVGTGSAPVNLTVLTKPTITKAFSLSTITVGGTSTITFTLANSNASNLTAATFTDTLNNMSISGAQTAGGTCTGAGANSFANGDTSLTFSGLTIPSSGSCTVTVLVTSSTAGVNPNVTSGVTTSDTTVGSPSASVNLTVLTPPSIVKAFSPATISSGGTSTVTFTLTNSNASVLTGANFTDTLANMAISSSQNAGGTCVGASTNSFTAGATNLTFSGITIPASGSCTVTMVVTSSVAGVNPNVTSGVTTTQTTIGSSSASVNLTVLAKPTITKGFYPATITTGDTSTITFTLANSTATDLTSATFTDTLSGMSISGDQTAGGTCTGAGSNTFVNAATSLTFSGLTIPAGSNCTVTVLVTSSTVGTHPNSTSGVTTAQTTVGTGSATVNLVVLAKPTIAKAFGPAAITSGATSTITFTLTNSNTIALTGASFTDTLSNISVSGTQNAGGTCTGASSNSFTDGATGLLNFTGITIPANSAACTVTILVTSTHDGANPNTASGVTTTETTVGSSSATVNLTVMARPTIAKAFNPATITEGGTSTITFTLTNTYTSNLTNASFTDTLTNMSISGAQNASGTCTGASSNGFANGATNLSFSGITLPASGSCTVTVLVTSSTVGTNSNVTSGVTTNETTLGTPSAIVNLIVLAKASITKAFGPSTISTGDTSTITFTLANSNTIDLTSATFSDTLNDMSISGAQSAGGTCVGAGTNSFANGVTALSFSGITIPSGGNCTVTVVVTSNVAGVQPNSTSGVTTAETTVGSPSASVDLTVLAKPTITKAFNPAVISATQTSTITFTLINTDSINLTSATFTDTLTDMSISGPQNAGGTCTGASGNTFADGDTSLSFTGITIPASGSCTVTVLVTSSTPGVQPNTTSGITTAETTLGSPSSTANLTVLAPPTIIKAFSPGTITTGGTSTITFTLTNSNATELTNAQFADTLSNMAISSAQSASGTCVGASTNNFTLGATNLNFSGITIPAINSCTVTVTVTSTNVGVNPNITSGVDTTQTLPGPVSSTVYLTVLAKPTITKAFSPATISSGDTTTIIFTLANNNATNLTGATFTDTLSQMSISGAQTAGGTCAGVGTNSFVNGETDLTFSGITIPATGSCTVTIAVTSSAVGTHPNTTSGVTTDDTTVGPPASTVNLTVTSLSTPAIAVVKTSTTSAITAANQVVPYSFSITNPGNTDLHTITVTDAMCDGTPAFASGDTNSDSVLQQTETWIYTCSHTVTQTEFDAGGTLTNTVLVDSAETSPVTGTLVINILGTITGTVWNDLNGNGSMDSGELPLSGVTVRLYDNSNNLVGTAITGASGAYSFSGLTDGNYTVVETDQSGYSSTTPNSVATTILAGNHRILDFGDLRIAASTGTGTITGTVINDVNGNGARDGGESPIAGVNLNLLDQNGNVIRTTTTAVDGSYSFTILPPGKYSVVEADPVGYISTTLNTVSVFLAGSQVADVNYFDQVTTGADIYDPAVTKQGSPERAVVGDEVVYTITVGNTGNRDASDVTLVDTKPAFLDILTVTINPNPGITPVISGNTITINFVTIPAGASYTVTVITRVNATGTPPGGTNHVDLNSDPTINLNDRGSNNSAAAALAITIPTSGGGGGPDDDEDNSMPSRIPQTGFAPGEVSLILPGVRAVDYASTNFKLMIPVIGLNTPLVGVPKQHSDWDIEWLGNDVGYLQGTAFPTLAGNSVLSGHVYDRNGKPGPFSNLEKLKWGDTVQLKGFGHTYTYEIRTVTEVTPEDIAYVFHHEDFSWLTLFTCKNYDEKTGTYKSRIVVKAVLMQIKEN